jgi:hypothetical protein
MRMQRWRQVAMIAVVMGCVNVGGTEAQAAPTPTFRAHIVRILSPATDQVVTGSRVRVTIALPSSVKRLRVGTGTGYKTFGFRIAGRRASGTIPVSALRFGENAITVRVTTSRLVGETHVRVLRGRRSRSLMSVKVSGRSSLSVTIFGPVAMTVLRATLNGRNISREFRALSPKRWAATLSAAHGLRHGRNTLRVLLARRSNGAWLEKTRTIVVGAGAILPSIRPSYGGVTGAPLRLDARPSRGVGRRPHVTFRWSIVRRPRGSNARLRAAVDARPRLVPDKAGRYVIRLKVTQRLATIRRHQSLHRRVDSQLASSARTKVVTASISRTYDVAPPFGPFGESIQTLAAANGGGYEMQIGSQTVPLTIGNQGYEIAFINRASGAIDKVASVLYGDEPALQNVLSSSPASPGELVVVAAQPTGQGSMSVSGTDLAAFNDAMQSIGANVPSSFIGTGGFSVIGIPGAPPGAAWENLGGDQTRYGIPAQTTGSILGRLLPDSNSSITTDASESVIELTFMFTGYVPFNTGTNGSATGISVSTPTPVFVGLPSSPGPGGFQVAVLDVHALFPTATGTFCTVAGCPDPAGAESAMLGLLDDYNTSQQIVIVQSFGTVAPGSDEGWGALADQIRNMGGNPDLFNTFQGSYAFIAAPGHAPAELSGNSTTDATAGFNGLFARDSQDRWYMAQTGLGTSSPNLQLPVIASADPQPFPYQGTSWLPKTEQYIESKLNKLGVQNTYCPANDCLRALYWLDNEGIDWGTASTNVKTVPEPQPSVFGCTTGTTDCAAKWSRIVTQFSNEFNYVTEMTSLFGAIEGTIPAAESSAGYDLNALTNDIENYIGQSLAKQDQKNGTISEALGILNGVASALSSLGSIAGVSSPGVGAAISVPLGVIAGGATIAGATATSSTSRYPALQGQVLASAATIGETLADQFEALYSSLGTTENIVLGDGAKLGTIGQDINEAAPGWTYSQGSNTTATLDAVRLAMRRYIYENLYRQYVFPTGASHPKYPAYCAELGAADVQQILGSTTSYGGPGTNHAPKNHSSDAWYTFLITYAQQSGHSPLGTADSNGSGDTSLAYPAGSSLFDTTGNNSTDIPASQFAYAGQPTNVGPPSQLFQTPVDLPYTPPDPNDTTPVDTGGLGLNVSEFFWNVFQPYGTYTASQTGYVGVC